MNRTLRELHAAVAAGPPYEKDLLDLLENDLRTGAQALYRCCLRRMKRAKAEETRLHQMMKFEEEAQTNGFQRVAGVDEAGRGPLAGPIVAAAVVLSHPVPGLNDSKKLKATERTRLFSVLHAQGHAIGLAILPNEVIDRTGIQSANYAAMVQACAKLEPHPDFLLVDGFRIPACPFPHTSIVKGDARSLSIAAASIVAKVVRDRIMDQLDRQYPAYGFARHKGYATADHLAAIREYGPCPAHRLSFAPMSEPAQTDFETSGFHGSSVEETF